MVRKGGADNGGQIGFGRLEAVERIESMGGLGKYSEDSEANDGIVKSNRTTETENDEKPNSRLSGRIWLAILGNKTDKGGYPWEYETQGSLD